LKQQVFKIIHNEDDILVIEKLVPFLSQRADKGEQESLYEFISRAIQQKIYPVHRLDRDVLGLMIYGKTKEAADFLSEQFRNRTIKKAYEARVYGRVNKDEETLVHYLKKNTKTNYVTVFPRETPGAKRAELTYRVLERLEEQTRLYVELKTGRPHQIRAQLAKIGHPIVGDDKYAKRKNTDMTQIPIGLKSVFLSVKHPKQDEVLTWSLI
jgi:23S rRNA pseudouridine1911/1915/1917 synthase